MGETISSIASGAFTIQSLMPGSKPSVPRSGGMLIREIWTFLSTDTAHWWRVESRTCSMPSVHCQRRKVDKQLIASNAF